jgi:soluble lytic murein transglycosylase-like protein
MKHRSLQPLFPWICLLAVSALSLRAQAPTPVGPNQAQALMQESLDKQRAAVQKQQSQTSGQSFFVLPRPTTMGATTPAPASQVSVSSISGQSTSGQSAAVADCTPLPASEVDSLVGQASEREGLDQDLLRGVIKQESGFRPCAVSSKGAMGLMQLMPATAGQFGITNPFDAASNVDGGAKFLKQLLNRYSGDIPRALGAYNAGPAKVDAAGGVPAIPETVDYIRQIMSNLPFIEH